MGNVPERRHMERTISVDGLPKWLLQFLVAGVAVFMALWGVLAVYSAAVGGFDVSGRPWLFVAMAAAWLVLTVAWVWRAQGWETSGSVWDAIPDEQYTGRFAEAGGLARDSWEKALPDDEE